MAADQAVLLSGLFDFGSFYKYVHMKSHCI